MQNSFSASNLAQSCIRGFRPHTTHYFDPNIFVSACPMADHLYKATLDTIPGAFCLMNAGFLLLLSVFFLAVLVAIQAFKVPLTSE